MTEREILKALTGNHLLTGQVVFYSKLGGWSAEPGAARLAESVEEAQALEALGKEAEADGKVIAVELIDMELKGGKPWPTRNREQIRALGPTVRQDLGYQADNGV